MIGKPVLVVLEAWVASLAAAAVVAAAGVAAGVAFAFVAAAVGPPVHSVCARQGHS